MNLKNLLIKKYGKIFFGILIFLYSTLIYASKQENEKMIFCTAIDSDFFEYGLQLIGSLHRVNFAQTEEIAVFDLGLTSFQRSILQAIQKVVVYNVELTHPDLLKIFELGRSGKKGRGWYAWKPVIIKQLLEKYPYLLYLDAGCIILRPLNGLFKYIEKEKSFLINMSPNDSIPESIKIKNHCTSYVKNAFLISSSRNNILDAPLLVAGILGISRALYDSLVLPMYELTKDLRNYEDDGTCPGGFGQGFSDMTLYSIYAHLLELPLQKQYRPIPIGDNKSSETILVAANYDIPSDASIVYQHRGRLHFNYFIKFKDTYSLFDMHKLCRLSDNF